jgi:hypothetical protein
MRNHAMVKCVLRNYGPRGPVFPHDRADIDCNGGRMQLTAEQANEFSGRVWERPVGTSALGHVGHHATLNLFLGLALFWAQTRSPDKSDARSDRQFLAPNCRSDSTNITAIT